MQDLVDLPLQAVVMPDVAQERVVHDGRDCAVGHHGRASRGVRHPLSKPRLRHDGWNQHAQCYQDVRLDGEETQEMRDDSRKAFCTGIVHHKPELE